MNQAVRASGCSRAQLGIYVILSAQYNADCIVQMRCTVAIALLSSFAVQS